MKKIALCFSGHPRNFESCFQSVKTKIIDKYFCDIFISTYYISEDISKRINDLYKPKKILFNKENIIAKEAINYSINLGGIKTLDNLYIDADYDVNNAAYFNTHLSNVNKSDMINFKNYGINLLDSCYYNKTYSLCELFDYDNLVIKNFAYHNIFPQITSQFLGIYDVSKLCLNYITDNNIEYDYIIRIRLDDEIIGDFILDENLEEDQVVINCLQKYNKSFKVQDHFYMAKPNTYFKISNLYSNLSNIVKYINSNNCWMPLAGCNETLLLIHILLNNIKIKYTKGDFWIIKHN